jgi:hypothetical protein
MQSQDIDLNVTACVHPAATPSVIHNVRRYVDKYSQVYIGVDRACDLPFRFPSLNAHISKKIELGEDTGIHRDLKVRYSICTPELTFQSPRVFKRSSVPSEERVIAALSHYFVHRTEWSSRQLVYRTKKIDVTSPRWIEDVYKCLHLVRALINVYDEVLLLKEHTNAPAEELLAKFANFNEAGLVLTVDSLNKTKKLVMRMGKETYRMTTQQQFIQAYKRATYVVSACTLKLDQLSGLENLVDAFGEWMDDAECASVSESEDRSLYESVFNRYDRCNTEAYALFKCVLGVDVVNLCNKYLRKTGKEGITRILDFYRNNKIMCEICCLDKSISMMMHCPQCDGGACVDCYNEVKYTKHNEVSFVKCPFCRHEMYHDPVHQGRSGSSLRR